MEFTDELLQKLESDGISFSREDNGHICYMSNYEHARAEIDPVSDSFKVVNECCDGNESGVICERTFANQFDGRVPSAEDVLRDIASACGAIDQGLEDAFNTLSGYDIKSY